MPKNGLLSTRKGVINVNFLNSEKRAISGFFKTDFFYCKKSEAERGSAAIQFFACQLHRNDRILTCTNYYLGNDRMLTCTNYYLGNEYTDT